MGGVIDRQQLRGIDLGITLGGRELGMAEQFLDCAEITATGQQMGGEGVP